MKDSHYYSGLPKNWNGGVMSGGGLPEDGRGGQYPPWGPTAPPPLSHHHAQHNSVPRLMGGFFNSGRAPVAHLGPLYRGMKPPEAMYLLRPSEPGSVQAEGMDLSNRPAGNVSNGGQVNGQAKEAVVSVIAANPLRVGDKPMEPSDKSDDEDDDCMVIEEGEEAPSTAELAPSGVQPQLVTRPQIPAHLQSAVRHHDLPLQLIPPPIRHLQSAHSHPILKPDTPSIGMEAPPVVRHSPVLARPDIAMSKNEPNQQAMIPSQLPFPTHSEAVESRKASSPIIHQESLPIHNEPSKPEVLLEDLHPPTSVSPSKTSVLSTVKIPSPSGKIPGSPVKVPVSPPVKIAVSPPVKVPGSPPVKLPGSPSAKIPDSPSSKVTISDCSNVSSAPTVPAVAPSLNLPYNASTPTKFTASVSTNNISTPFSANVPTVMPANQEAPSSVDHVESLLEDMFQQEETPIPHPVIVTNSQRTPALTEDKVVAILEESESPEKSDIKMEVSDITQELPQKNNTFMQVESELEKMFAGIVESTDEIDIKPKIEPVETKKPIKRKSSGKPRIRKSDFDSPKKSKKADAKVKRASGTRDKIVKDGSNDSSIISSGKFKGPFLRIVGQKENPANVVVVNSAGDEEEKDRATDKVKRKTSRIVEGRVKGPGLYSSTLSSRYNSNTVDPTWICIFCKRRSHCETGLGGEAAGDLFGPYIVSVKVEGISAVGSPTDAEVALEQRKRGGGKQQSLRAIKAAHQFAAQHKKGKQKCVDDSISSKEVWVHEQCAIWAPGVIMVGPHLLGLDEAVSSAVSTKCVCCGEMGAGIGCLSHSCPETVHYGCAIAADWALDQDSFQAYCPNHKKTKVITLGMLQAGV